MAALNDAGVMSLVGSAQTVVNTDSTDSLGNIPYCRVRLAQCYRVSKCPLIPSRLCAKFIPNHKENLKTPPRRKSSLYTPKCVRSNLVSPKNRLSTPMKKQSTTGHNYIHNGGTKKESPIRVPANSKGQGCDGGSLLRCEPLSSRRIIKDPRRKDQRRSQGYGRESSIVHS